jgi:hypothetical protein
VSAACCDWSLESLPASGFGARAQTQGTADHDSRIGADESQPRTAARRLRSAVTGRLAPWSHSSALATDPAAWHEATKADDSAGCARDPSGSSSPMARSACKLASSAVAHEKTSGCCGRSSFCGDHRLGAAPCGDFRPILARDLRGMQKKPAVDMSKTYTIRRDFTGATGLEPATSGVTGRRSNQLNYAPRRTRV